MRRALRLSAALAISIGSVFGAGGARASNVEEFPDNGSEQQGRGGAWVARASDPLAAFYNPAGLAGQRTQFTLQANIAAQSTCFTRVKAVNDPTANDGVGADGKYPQVCNDGGLFPNPQLGFTWRATDRLGLGIAVLGPSGVGNLTWPEFINGTTPSPQRYLLTKSDVLILTPTIGVGWEPVDGLRIGASFQFGTAPKISFTNASSVINKGGNPGEPPPDPADNDARATLTASQIFIPGATLGAIWSPLEDLDVAGWYKWSAPIDAKGDVQTAYPYFTPQVAKGDLSRTTYGDTSLSNCNISGFTNQCGSGKNGEIKVPIPMEAKLGFRYHQPRRDVPYDPHLRDPIAQDVFDAEVDFTWANDSAFDYVQIRFPANANGDGTLPANPSLTGAATVPPNADVRHHFKDVFGVRVGGDYNLLPDRLALRAGAFFETSAADPQYQSIDFDAAQRIGFAVGGTYRIKVGASRERAIDLMLGYGHVFFGTLDNSDPNAQGLSGLAGSPCNPAADPAGPTCPPGNLKYRTNWPVNLGTITSSINVINVGAAYRF
jgi:long-chain fatty acid transport protein